MAKPPVMRAFAAALLLGLAATSCISTGVDSYADFRSAVDSGASCEQLLDMRSNFDDSPGEQAKVDSDLQEIGCESPSSERTDQ